MFLPTARVDPSFAWWPSTEITDPGGRDSFVKPSLYRLFGLAPSIIQGTDGKTVTWMIEGASPNNLYRLGLTKESLPPGSVISVEGYQAKDGTRSEERRGGRECRD